MKIEGLSRAELIGLLGLHKRHVVHLEEMLGIPHTEWKELPYSHEGNDSKIQDIGFDEDIETALHLASIFTVSQILNYGRKWLDKEIGWTRTERLKVHLLDMGVLLPD